MAQVIAMAIATVAAFVITYNRAIGFKSLLKNAIWIDVAFTIAIGVVFAGTLTGMLVAVFSGLILSLFLSIAKWGTRLPKFNLVSLGWMRTHPVKPLGDLDPTEFDKNGRWIYNEAPYV